jgi:hypothetical protein
MSHPCACGRPIALSTAKRCRACYFEQVRLRSIEYARTREERFWSRVDKTGECWAWRGSVQNRQGRAGIGYGIFGNTYAHRYAWEITHGLVPAEMQVLHRCDNPLCVRPEHLRVGTARDNSSDMVQRGRSAAGERQPRRKLAWKDVREIRSLRVTDGLSYAALGRRFQISATHAGSICAGRFWKGSDSRDHAV